MLSAGNPQRHFLLQYIFKFPLFITDLAQHVARPILRYFQIFSTWSNPQATASAFAAAGRSRDRQDTASSGAGLEGLEVHEGLEGLEGLEANDRGR